MLISPLSCLTSLNKAQILIAEFLTELGWDRNVQFPINLSGSHLDQYDIVSQQTFFYS